MLALFLQFEYVQPGETLQISLLATDQVENSREAVWSLEAPSSTAVSHYVSYSLCVCIHVYTYMCSTYIIALPLSYSGQKLLLS